MKTIKTRTLTAGLALALAGVTSNVCAQDQGPGNYLAMDGGIAIEQDITIKDSGGAKAAFDRGLRIDFAAGIGNHRPNSFCFEMGIGVIHNSMKPVVEFDSERLDLYQIPM